MDSFSFCVELKEIFDFLLWIMFSLVRAIYNYVIDDSQGRLLSGYNPVKLSCNTYNHRLKMELDLQS